MRSQEYNKGDLKELNVNIEADVVDTIKSMSGNSGLSVEEIVVIALKRFITHHSDYINNDSDPTK